MRMRVNVLLVLFWIVLLTEVPHTESFDLKNRLASTDKHYLDQLNTIRSYVGSGYLRNVFSDAIIHIAKMVMKGIKAIKSVINEFAKVGKYIADAAVGWLGIDLGKKRSVNYADRDKAIEKPLLGPATKMNELRWNKRLSQLVYAEMDTFAANPVACHRNRTYRAFQHGSLFESLANDFFPFLRRFIDTIKEIWTCFVLLTSDVEYIDEQPVVIDESKITGEIFEFLFDYYVEAGCGSNADGSWCLIGPVDDPKGSMKDQQILTTIPHQPCIECNTTCLKETKLCESRPDFEDQARLRQIMEGDVTVEEMVIEEVTFMPPDLESFESAESFSWNVFLLLGFVYVFARQ